MLQEDRRCVSVLLDLQLVFRRGVAQASGRKILELGDRLTQRGPAFLCGNRRAVCA
jgi:hypothetical protein